MARLTDLIRKAEYENRDLAELQELARQAVPRKMGLPTTWRDRTDGVQIRSHDTPVVTPSGREIALYGESDMKVCGGCAHFSIEEGRRKMKEEQFPDRLVQEMGWKLKHLGAPMDSLGACREDPTLLTTIVSKACSNYKPKPGKKEFTL